MTTVHPRRALAEAEAAAWLELHSDWCRGLPAEVRDTSVIGADRPSGDGRSLPWYRLDGSFTGSPAPQGYVPQGLSDWAPGWESWYGWGLSGDQWGEAERRGPAAPSRPAASVRWVQPRRDSSGWGESVASAPITDAPAAGEPLPLRGRALRAVAQQGTEQLRPVTVAMGDRVPAAMRYDRHLRCATHSMADLSGYADTSWQEQMAAAELLAWLRLEAGLTERELEALQCRAAGLPQPTRSDRETLARAQRRARAALLAR
jgi:hypothetical protein